MKTFTTIRFTALSIFAFLLFITASKAATYTAEATGNWSSSATWGTTAPSFTNTSDVIIIPSGITVTMDNNVTINGALASLNVEGTLSGSSTTYLTVATGTLSGAGTINSGYVSLNTGALLTYTGAITTDYFSNMAISLKSAAMITVNKSLTLGLASVLSIETGGSLTLANGVTLVMGGGTIVSNGGTLLLTSTYNVEYDASTTAGAELLGSGLNDVTLNVANNGTVTLSKDLNVKGTLTLTNGVLALGTSNLTISGDVAAGGSGTISSTSASDITISTSSSIGGNLSFSGANNTVNNLTITVGGSNHAQINGTLTVAGTLTLNSGTLNLGASSELILKGDISATGNGNISADPTANLTVNGSTSPVGMLMFSGSGSSINNLTIDIANNGTVKAGSNFTVTGILHLANGRLNIGANTLQMGSSATVTGASSTNYIITESSGYVSMSLTAGGSVTTYPIGTSDKYYPATAQLNSGAANGNVMVNVMPHVYAHGNTNGTIISATEPVVDATWDYKTDIASNLNINIGIMWAASAEVNSFDRTQAYISHYTNGAWDVSATASATASGSMYGMTRSNITSLSPFAVLGKNANSGIENAGLMNNGMYELYPNPAKDILYVSNATPIPATYMEIISISGQVVGAYKLDGTSTAVPVANLQNGCYFVKIYNTNSVVNDRFIKM